MHLANDNGNGNGNDNDNDSNQSIKRSSDQTSESCAAHVKVLCPGKQAAGDGQSMANDGRCLHSEMTKQLKNN